MVAVVVLLVAAALGAWVVTRGGAGTTEEVEAVLAQHGFTCGDEPLPAGTPDELSASVAATNGGASSAVETLRGRIASLPAGVPLSLRVCAPSGWLLQSGTDVVVVAVGGADLEAVRGGLRGVEVALIDAPELIPVPDGEVAEDPPPVPSAPATTTTVPPSGTGGGAIDSGRSVTCGMAASTIRSATEAFHATNGSWPTEMSDLVGDWLGEIPQQVGISFDPAGDAPPRLQWSAECAGVPGP